MAYKAQPAGRKRMIKGDLLNLNTHRKIAKIGMSATLATTCLSSFYMTNKTIRNIHTISGWAFVGFSLYHAGLYDNGIFKQMITKAQKRNLEQKRIVKAKKDKNEAKRG